MWKHKLMALAILALLTVAMVGISQQSNQLEDVDFNAALSVDISNIVATLDPENPTFIQTFADVRFNLDSNAENVLEKVEMESRLGSYIELESDDTNRVISEETHDTLTISLRIETGDLKFTGLQFAHIHFEGICNWLNDHLNENRVWGKVMDSDREISLIGPATGFYLIYDVMAELSGIGPLGSNSSHNISIRVPFDVDILEC